jgi:hypothetical protein
MTNAELAELAQIGGSQADRFSHAEMNVGDLFHVRPTVGTTAGATWAMEDFNGDGDIDGSQPVGFEDDRTRINQENASKGGLNIDASLALNRALDLQSSH